MTTIQISKELHTLLEKRKLYDNEPFEDVIWDMVEDSLEINEQTKKNLAKSRAEIRSGKVHSLEQIKKELRIDV
ncbi:MAG TPA: hypothetical protein VJ044_02055 [Candidatus Hodarchaeales archaeon]|nr:hypothetical protein [Candidatus Hodarchaeales archaeon]HLC84482.1 hypothetical protein [Candidatus Nanoarchaeia archaeon]